MKMASLFLGVVSLAMVGDKKVTVTVIPRTAEIWVNGVQVGKGSYELKIKDGDKALVVAREPGYVTESVTFFNDKAHPAPPKLYPITLTKDPSFESSTTTDIVNKDIDIQTRRPEEEAWRLITQIVSGAFDVIEVTDMKSGYLRTAWSVNRFPPGASIRTRVIVKMGNPNPLAYKVKVVTEWAPAGTSSRDDEKWTEWDRILRIHQNLIPEIQTRLAGGGSE